MPWEQRGQQRYFYKCRRINGKVVKEYFGNGPLAYAMEQLMAAKQQARAANKLNLEEAHARLESGDAAVDQLRQAAETAMAAQITPQQAAPASQAQPVKTRFGSAQEVVARFKQLLGTRRNGDPSVELELRQIMDRFPELWAQLGDLGEHAIGYWIQLIGGNDELVKQAIRQKLKTLRAEFSASAHDPASKLLVERVVATWMQMQYADSRYAAAGNVGDKGFEFLARRQQQAQKQHLAALQAWRQWRQLAGSLPGFSAPAAEAPKSAPATNELEPCILPFPLQAASA